jgi:hypothetical protein
MLWWHGKSKRASGGDKTGRWTEWYRENIPLADDLYDKHLVGEKI